MAKGGAAAAPAVVCTDAGTVRLMLGEQPAAGLFVLYRVAPAKPEGAQSWIETVAPKVPPPPFTLGFVDGQGFLVKVVSDNNPWHDLGPQLAELEAAAVKGATKGKGKTKKGAKALSRSCESEKLHADVEYEIVLVAHPSLRIAKAALEYLNSGKATGPYPFPRRSEMPLRTKLTLVEDKGSHQLTLAVESLAGGKKPQTLFWPKGSARYDGWVLYRLMPYDHLAAVKQQVARLCEDLAALRYPSSLNADDPFPGPGQGQPGFAVHTAAIVHTFQKAMAGARAFQLAPASGPNGALAKAALPAGWRTLAPRPSWQWLCGQPIADLKKAYSFTAEQVHPGVVDARTGDAIAGFIKDKLRHPGAVLIDFSARMSSQGDWRSWGRAELVFSFEMLRVLLARFGVPYGAAFNHTYRPIASPGGTGRAECSNHKLGVAVDLAIQGAAGGKASIQDHGHPAECFPVRYEAVYGDPALPPLDKLQEAMAKATQARIQAEADVTAASAAVATAQASGQRKELSTAQKQQKAAGKALKNAEKKEEQAAAILERKHAIGETKADQNLSWVICAHSYWDIFAAGKTAEQIGGELATCLGKPAEPEAPWDVEREYRNLLLSGFPSAPVGYAAELVGKFVGKLRAVCEALTAMEPMDFRKQLFRKTVRQFQYNCFERDGGDEGPEIAADSDEAWRTPYVDASKRVRAFHDAISKYKRESVRSFVNLSRLANECDLWGISAVRGNAKTKGSFRNPMADPDIPVKPPARLTYTVDAKSFPALASLLADLKAAGPEAPDHQIDLKLPDGTDVSTTSDELDIDFLIAWAEEMGKKQEHRIGKPEPPKDGKKGEKPPPPAISWSGTDAVVLGHPGAGQEANAFCTHFSDERFKLVTVGSALSSSFSSGEAMTGSEISDALQRYWKVSKPQIVQPETKKGSTKKSPADYSVTIRPIVQAKDKVDIALTSGTQITLPAHGVPAPLEWWHYEQGLRGTQSYGQNAEDLGYSLEFLVAEKAPPVADTAPEVGGFGFPAKRMGNKRTLRKVQTNVSVGEDSEEGESDE